MSSELWWHTNAKLITPIAWKRPGPRTVKRCAGAPLSSGGTCSLSMSTDATMMIMPTSASPDARESLWMSRYSESGYETQIVQSAITNWRFVSSERPGTLYRFGKTERMTCGMVSPARVGERITSRDWKENAHR